MSDTAQKETEFVSGAIEGVTQKKADTWTVQVKPDGSQYTKALWTKDSELVAALAQKIGQEGGFVCGVSHWERDGQSMRSLWIEAEGGPMPQNVNASQPALPQTNSNEGMTSEKWDAKERRDYRSRAWAQTLGAFTHTIKVDEKPEDVFARLQPFQRKVFTDVCQSFAFPGDESDVPF